MNGLAITIIVGQLPKLFGFSTDADSLRRRDPRSSSSTSTRRRRPRSSSASACCVVLLGLPRLTTKVPAVLVAVVGATVVSAAFGLSDEIATVGTLPSGFPTPHVPVDAAQRRGPAAHRRGRDHPRVAHRHDRDVGRVRRPARRRGRSQPGDGRASARRTSPPDSCRASPCRRAGRAPRWPSSPVPRASSPGSSAPASSPCSCCSSTTLLADLPQSALAAVVIAAALSLLNLGALRRYWQVRRSAVRALAHRVARRDPASACSRAS